MFVDRSSSQPLRGPVSARTAFFRWVRGGALGLGLVLLVLSGCRTRAEAEKETEPAPVVDTKPIADQLPPLRLADDTADLLLTWIDEQGDFHVVEKPADVPETARAQVRVVVTTKSEGTGRLVYVANLSQRQPDGTYPVSTMTRAAWNELGAARRKVRLDALLERRAAREAAASSDGAGPAGSALPSGQAEAIVYGADWCKPCHQAETYLKSLGVTVTKKDIEKSPAARSEMEQKLSKAGQAGASIPVIDVMGQLFIGFNKGVLRRAVERSLSRKTL